MKKFLLTIFVMLGMLVIPVSANNTITAEIVSITPALIDTPGEQVSITVSFSGTLPNMGNAQTFRYAAYISQNPVWAGGAGATQVQVPTIFTTTTSCHHNCSSRDFSGIEQTFTFTMPGFDIRDLGMWEGNWYVIIIFSGGEGGTGGGGTNVNNWDRNNFITQRLPIRQKSVILNTAFVGDKSSLAGVIISKAPPRLDIFAVLPNGDTIPDGEPYHFEESDIRFNLEAIFRDEHISGANISYTIHGLNLPAVSHTSPATVHLTAEMFRQAANTIRITATASGDEFDPSLEKEWIFVRNLQGAELELFRVCQNDFAVAGLNELNIMGAEQAFTFQFSAEEGLTLRYNSGSAPIDSLTLRNSGTEATLTSTHTITASSVNDTIFVSAYVFGGDSEPTYRVWRFAPDYLPELVLTPRGDQSEHKFVGTVSVTVNLPNAGEFCDLVIRYTIDGSEPTPTNGLILSSGGTIPTISQTTELKIAAFAGNRLPNPVQTHRYRLVAEVSGAWYYNTTSDRADGRVNGAIDRVVIRTTIPVENVPDSVRLISPWNANETRTFRANQITGANGTDLLEIVVPSGIFPFSGQTGFTPDPTRPLGRIFGAEYADNETANSVSQGAFEIRDSIAPVAVRAIFMPGSIIESEYRNNGIIVRNPDRLIVNFSENKAIIQGETEIFEFYSRTGAHYSFNLEAVDVSENTVAFEVIGSSGDGFPATGDSLSVMPNRIKDSRGVIQENATVWIPMEVGETPYFLVITPISSFVHDPRFPDVITGEAVPIALANFLTALSPQQISGLNINGRIIDPLGNVVAQFSGLNGRGSGSAFAEITEIKSKMRDRNGNELEVYTSGILVYWNAQNRSGRRVGSGAYRVIISISGDDGISGNTSFTIGVGAAR